MAKRETLPVDPRRRDTPVAIRVAGSGREIALPRTGRLQIGSDRENDLVLDDHYVSAFHCLIERQAGRWLVRDRGSRNGTFVNGSRVTESEVEAGSRLLVGQCALSVVGRLGQAAPTSLVGEDPRFRRALDTAVRAAPSRATVLIVGESGTGKELVA